MYTLTRWRDFIRMHIGFEESKTDQVLSLIKSETRRIEIP